MGCCVISIFVILEIFMLNWTFSLLSLMSSSTSWAKGDLHLVDSSPINKTFTLVFYFPCSKMRSSREILRQRNEIPRQRNKTLRQRNKILRQRSEILRQRKGHPKGLPMGRRLVWQCPICVWRQNCQLRFVQVPHTVLFVFTGQPALLEFC